MTNKIQKIAVVCKGTDCLMEIELEGSYQDIEAAQQACVTLANAHKDAVHPDDVDIDFGILVTVRD